MRMKIRSPIEGLVTMGTDVRLHLNLVAINRITVNHTVVWVNRCLVKLPGCRNARPQCSHLNGFSPVWILYKLLVSMSSSITWVANPLIESSSPR